MRSPDHLPVYHAARDAVLRDPRAAEAWWGLVDDLTRTFRKHHTPPGRDDDTPPALARR